MKAVSILISSLLLVLITACNNPLTKDLGGDGQSCFPNDKCRSGYQCVGEVCVPVDGDVDDVDREGLTDEMDLAEDSIEEEADPQQEMEEASEQTDEAESDDAELVDQAEQAEGEIGEVDVEGDNPEEQSQEEQEEALEQDTSEYDVDDGEVECTCTGVTECCDGCLPRNLAQECDEHF